ncbi:MAG: hypothetical protein J3K34DRAFT_377511 [Monoraphidium minutum]|nr:MAG: hypothetical protein J3K34DRAFT_377511 [Monoraphidium minutum]
MASGLPMAHEFLPGRQARTGARVAQCPVHPAPRSAWTPCSGRRGALVRARSVRQPTPPHDPQQLARAPPATAVLAMHADRVSALDVAAGPADGGVLSGQHRLRIAVDVDEVLGRFVFALNDFCKQQYGMSYDVADYWVYEFAKRRTRRAWGGACRWRIWGCSQEHSNHIVHEFFKSDHFNDGIPVIPEAFDTLQRLGSWCDMVVVTSRQHIIQDATLEWIDRHYPGLFREVYFGNHFALEGASRKKSDICASVGAHVLIDDNVGYALDCAGHGIDVLLYDWQGGYPWSKLPAGSEHPKIHVVHSWAEVEQRLIAMAPTVTASASSSSSSAASSKL